MIVKYKVKFIDEQDYMTVLSDKGIVCGDTDIDCINNIKKYYGVNNILEYSIAYLREEGCENIVSEIELDEFIRDVKEN